jgi:hypothetical protein
MMLLSYSIGLRFESIVNEEVPQYRLFFYNEGVWMVSVKRWKQRVPSQWMEPGAVGPAGQHAQEHVEQASSQLPGTLLLVSLLQKMWNRHPVSCQVDYCWSVCF